MKPWQVGALILVLLSASTHADVNVSGTPVNASQVGSPWGVQANPTTASTAALTTVTKAAVTSGVNVKASAGNVYAVFANNGSSSTICWVQFLNSASTGTLGTAVIFSIPLAISGVVDIPAGAFPMANFSTGIAVGISTTATGAVACGTAGNVVVFYN